MKQPTFKRHSGRRSGSVIILTAGGLLLFAGCAAIAVDYGLLVADANRLQRGCDAGALAGAQLLKITGDDNYDTYQARTVAVQVAAQNGVTVNSGNITFLNSNTQIRVPSTTTRAFFFARVLGQTSGDVTRSATAGVAPGDDLTTAPGAPRVAPIGISWETYNAYKDDRVSYHEIELIRQNKTTFDIDDLVLFDLRTDINSKSGAHLQNQLAGLEIREASLGDFDNTLNADQPAARNHFTRGLDDLFDQSQNAPWNDNDHTHDGIRYNEILNGTSPRDNPRVGYLIITPGTFSPTNGTFNTQVQGFAPVYFESYDQRTNAGEQRLYLRVRFLPPGTAGDSGVTINPGGTLSGIRVVSLVD